MRLDCPSALTLWRKSDSFSWVASSWGMGNGGRSHKVRAEGRSNLTVVHVPDSVTAVYLLPNPHNKNSLRHLPLEGKGKTGSKHLSFCPFCLYTGSNDQLYMNHITCNHYDMAYGCRKCLDKVTVLGQQMSNHFKYCKVLKEKSMGPKKVSDDVQSMAGPSSNAKAGSSKGSTPASVIEDEDMAKEEHKKKKK